MAEVDFSTLPDDRFPQNQCRTCRKPIDDHCFMDYPIMYCPGETTPCRTSGPWHLPRQHS